MDLPLFDADGHGARTIICTNGLFILTPCFHSDRLPTLQVRAFTFVVAFNPYRLECYSALGMRRRSANPQPTAESRTAAATKKEKNIP